MFAYSCRVTVTAMAAGAGQRHEQTQKCFSWTHIYIKRPHAFKRMRPNKGPCCLTNEVQALIRILVSLFFFFYEEPLMQQQVRHMLVLIAHDVVLDKVDQHLLHIRILF